jgi:hypothetical protein
MSPEQEGERVAARSSFWTAAKTGFSKLLEEAPTAWDSPDERFYRQEKQIIMEVADPIYTGLLVTGFLFVTFRVSGSTWYRTKFLKEATAQVSSEPAGQVVPQWKNYLQREAEATKEKVGSEFFRNMPVDILLSLMCGVSATVWLFDPKKLHLNLARAPLLPGRSVVYTTVCPEMIAAHSVIDPRVFVDYSEDTTLRTFQSVVRNCQARSDFIAKQLASNVETPDVIPFPGLKSN